MRCAVALILFVCCALPLTLSADTSKVAAVQPPTAKVGDVLTATGEGLAKTSVTAVFLTNGTDDFKAEVVEQTETAVKFKVPAAVKPGRWAVMLQVKDGMLLEQPVKVTIE